MTTRYLLKCLLLLSVLFCQQAVFGQTGTPGTINTYAGSDAVFAGAGQPATAAQLVGANNMVVDGQGNVYFSAAGLATVLKVATNGVVFVVAGNGLSSGGGDGGLAVGASLAHLAGLALDSKGNLYIADTANSNVRKVDTNGIITTVAGGGGAGGFSGDGGPATKALLANPIGIAVDQSGNLYIADRLNNRIRMVTASSGIISTIAGSSTTGLSGDGGPAATLRSHNPTASRSIHQATCISATRSIAWSGGSPPAESSPRLLGRVREDSAATTVWPLKRSC